MSDLSSNDSTLTVLTAEPIIDEAHLAAAAFLARYSGRTLDAYRFDLRTFFQWASDVGLAILEATRPTSSSTEVPWKIGDWLLQQSTGVSRRYAASTGSPTSTGGSTPTQPGTSGVPRVTPPRAEGSTERSSGPSCSRPNGSTKPCRPRRTAWPQRSTGQRSLRDQYRGPRLHPGTPHASDHGQGKQAGHHSVGATGGPDHRPRHR